MKWLGLGLVLVLGILMVGPLIVGFSVESRLEEGNPGNVHEFKVVEFERGWFSSNARVELKPSKQYLAQFGAMLDPDTMADVAQGVALPMETVVAHGPLGFHDGMFLGWMKVDGRLDRQNEEIREVLANLGVDRAVTVQTTTSLGGDTQFDIHVSPLTYEEDGASLKFNGLDVSGSVNLAPGGFMHADVTLQPLTYQDGGNSAQVTRMRFHTDMDKYSKYLWLGSSEVELGQISAQLPGETSPYEINDFKLETVASNNDGMVHNESTITLGSLVSPVSVQNFSMDVDFGNFDIDALNNVVGVISESSYSSEQTEEAMLEALEAVEDDLGALMRGSPYFRIGPTTVDYEGETVKADMRFSVNGATLPEGFKVNAISSMMLLPLMEAEMSLSLPESIAVQIAGQQVREQLEGSGVPADQQDQIVASQVPVVLDSLIQQGMITKTSAGYEVVAKYANGSATVNGKPVPLGALF